MHFPAAVDLAVCKAKPGLRVAHVLQKSNGEHVLESCAAVIRSS